MKIIYAALISTCAFGVAIAQTSAPAAHSTASADASPTSMAGADAKRDAAVEKHIKELYATLKITPKEESKWNEVASTMRENAKDLDRAIDKRAAKAGNATAVDDLNAYAEIAQAHANNVKRLASAFGGLYSAMTDEQKKAADQAFISHHHDGNKVAKQ